MSPAPSKIEQGRRTRYIIRTLLFFWPIVDSTDDVDRVTRFGYHACLWALAYNEFAILPDLVNLDWMAWATFILLATVFFVAANALRQGSVRVAATLCLILASAIPYSYLLGRVFPWSALATFVAFVIVWRGIVLADRFRGPLANTPLPHPANVITPPSRFRVGRYLIDTLPAKIWPAAQPLFWIAAALLLLSEAFFCFAYVQLHRHA